MTKVPSRKLKKEYRDAYQTLMASVLHKYATGQLVSKGKP